MFLYKAGLQLTLKPRLFFNTAEYTTSSYQNQIIHCTFYKSGNLEIKLTNSLIYLFLNSFS